MHTPSYAKPLELKTTLPIRLLLVGIPGSGKTYSTASTFPNPIVFDVDNGLQSKDIRALNVPSISMWNPALRAEMQASLKPTSVPKHYSKFINLPGMAGLMIKFMLVEGPKFTPDQTIIFDSISTISDAVEADLWEITPLGKDKQPDGFWFWDAWADWWCQFSTLVTELKCNVVVTAHEAEVRDSETGRVLAYKWMLAGQKFSPRLSQFFTDTFRQLCEVKEDIATKKVTKTYSWQVLPSPQFPYCKTRMGVNSMSVPATYKSFDLYK